MSKLKIIGAIVALTLISFTLKVTIFDLSHTTNVYNNNSTKSESTGINIQGGGNNILENNKIEGYDQAIRITNSSGNSLKNNSIS